MASHVAACHHINCLACTTFPYHAVQLAASYTPLPTSIFDQLQHSIFNLCTPYALPVFFHLEQCPPIRLAVTSGHEFSLRADLRVAT